jgi:hypothetical protein
MPYRVGQTATNPKTKQQVKWDGQNWVAIPGTGLGTQTELGGGRSAQQDVKFLNDLSTQAADASEVERIYNRAAKDIHDFHTGPYRGRFMQMMTPDDQGGILDTIGGVVGAVPRALGAITPKDTTDYQKLSSLQQYRVLSEQTRQKGVQTEGDAARIKLAEISPSKTIDANMDIINNGLARMRRVQAKASFYTQWANKLGLHGTNEQGQTADQVWANNQDAITQSLVPHSAGSTNGATADIKVLARRKVGP